MTSEADRDTSGSPSWLRSTTRPIPSQVRSGENNLATHAKVCAAVTVIHISTARMSMRLEQEDRGSRSREETNPPVVPGVNLGFPMRTALHIAMRANIKVTDTGRACTTGIDPTPM